MAPPITVIPPFKVVPQGPTVDAATPAGTPVPLIYEQRWPRQVPFQTIAAPATTPPQPPWGLAPPEVWRWALAPPPPALAPILVQPVTTPVPLAAALLPPEPWRWVRTVTLGTFPLPIHGALLDAMTVAGSAIPLLYEQRWPRPVSLPVPPEGAAAQSLPPSLPPPEPWRWVPRVLPPALVAWLETVTPVVVVTQPPALVSPDRRFWIPPLPPPPIHPDLAQLVVIVDTDLPGIQGIDTRAWVPYFTPRWALPLRESLGTAFTQPAPILKLDQWRWTISYPPPPLVPRFEAAAAAPPQSQPAPLAQPEYWRWEALRQSGVHRYLVWDPSFGASVIVVVAGDGSILSIDMPELGGSILLGGGGQGGLT